MKYTLTAIIFLIQSFAAHAEVKDFNNLINDAQSDRKEFAQELKKTVGHETIAKKREKIVLQQPKEEAENIAAPSSMIQTRTSHAKMAKKAEKKNFERLSQEIKEITE